MLYDLDGEEWLPEYEAKKNYHVNLEKLTHAVKSYVLAEWHGLKPDVCHI